MTRTTVYRTASGAPRETTVADAYQQYGEDAPATAQIKVGSAMHAIEIPAGDPVDIFITGWPGLESEVDISRRFTVRLNGEEVEAGRLVQGRPAAVEIVPGQGRLTIPPGNGVEIDVYGDPVEVRE